MRRDFAAIRDAGFTVVRTYTLPPDDVIDAARDYGLLLFVEAFYPDWRYLTGASTRAIRDVARAAERTVRSAARALAGNPTIAALSVGNEVPADVVRWVGTRHVARAIADAVDAAREEDPDLLVTYANYPTAEYLPLPDLDFLTFNVFLEKPGELKRYLARLHNLAGDKPVVLGEFGLDAGQPDVDSVNTEHADYGELAQADALDYQLRTAVEGGAGGTCVFSWTDDWWVGGSRVDSWHFGLTREDRTPRPSLDVARAWNARDVRDVRDERAWPSISVVVCAYNAASTLDECLRHLCALDYPDFEVIVVDDGSTDATPDIALSHTGVRLARVQHGGLSAARNAGYSSARGEIVAYLDSDAYPSPEWLHYLALGFGSGNVMRRADDPDIAAVGGPNVPPIQDERGAQMVAWAPGGPVHVLIGDQRAEHIPGCNMAFRKPALVETGGFDPVYTAAGDDVDLCWKLLDANHGIAFHPAALVWHHRRAGVRAYLKQQAGYGRAEALVQARHPHRFTHMGFARWRGRIYGARVQPVARQSIYRGRFGASAFQSVYRDGGHMLDLLHQAGIPLAAGLLAATPLALLWRPYLLVVAATIAALIALFTADAFRVRPPARIRHNRLSFRLGVAALWLLQPLWRHWARRRAHSAARRDLAPIGKMAGPVSRMAGGVLLVPDSAPRAEVAESLVAALRRYGYSIAGPIGWEDHDACICASLLVCGDLVTSAYPAGWLQIRVRPHIRWRRLAAVAGLFTFLAVLQQVLAATIVAGATTISVAHGLWRTGPEVRLVIERMFAARDSHPAGSVDDVVVADSDADTDSEDIDDLGLEPTTTTARTPART